MHDVWCNFFDATTSFIVISSCNLYFIDFHLFIISYFYFREEDIFFKHNKIDFFKALQFFQHFKK